MAYTVHYICEMPWVAFKVEMTVFHQLQHEHIVPKKPFCFEKNNRPRTWRDLQMLTWNKDGLLGLINTELS